MFEQMAELQMCSAPMIREQYIFVSGIPRNFGPTSAIFDRRLSVSSISYLHSSTAAYRSRWTENNSEHIYRNQQYCIPTTARKSAALKIRRSPFYTLTRYRVVLVLRVRVRVTCRIFFCQSAIIGLFRFVLRMTHASYVVVVAYVVGVISFLPCMQSCRS